MNSALSWLLTGLGATIVMDAWGLIRKPLLNQPPPDYRMVGRWIGHMANGTFRHHRIAAAAPVSGERMIGWVVHHFTGILFAAGFSMLVGDDWLQAPTLGTAMAFGIGTVAAPFLVMQPAMGVGIAAACAPNPGAARLQSLITHAVFGFGLWTAASVILSMQ